jgi:hypothetical protein
MKEADVNWEQLLDSLASIDQEVDLLASRLYRFHSVRLQCRNGCSECCVDGITVFEVEGENIRRHYAELIDGGTPHPEGKCAFLNGEGMCRIYEHRPYVCRTQGLPLRWFEEGPDGSGVEMRDICPLNEEGEPIETLPPEACWTIGPFEEKLAALQSAVDGGKLRRLALRALFCRD